MTATLVLVLRIGLAIVLYYFLWRVMQTLRQDLKQQGNILSSQKAPKIHISVITDTGEKHEYDFRQTETLIGRGSHCAISIKDESLSANHARLSFHHAQWWLEDLDSTNGTILNNNVMTTPTVVISGDQFKCGNSTFTLQIDSSNHQISKRGGDE